MGEDPAGRMWEDYLLLCLYWRQSSRSNAFQNTQRPSCCCLDKTNPFTPSITVAPRSYSQYRLQPQTRANCADLNPQMLLWEIRTQTGPDASDGWLNDGAQLHGRRRAHVDAKQDINHYYCELESSPGRARRLQSGILGKSRIARGAGGRRFRLCIGVS